MSGEIADWTNGAEGLAYQQCRACGGIRYFRRGFCPACGSAEVETRQATGRGRVHSITTITRAPSQELRAYAPYRVALVDAEEGFRFMSHAAEGLSIGDPVTTRFRPFGARLLPFAEPERP